MSKTRTGPTTQAAADRENALRYITSAVNAMATWGSDNLSEKMSAYMQDEQFVVELRNSLRTALDYPERIRAGIQTFPKFFEAELTK
jgi:hypothetical protein